jgi:TolB-like protein
MSFFAELKRRNVFRVGIAYSIAAWVLLQITDVVGEILELPAWGGKLILLILVIGLPLSLILAWAFELTPEGVKRDKDVDRSASVAPQTGKKLDRVIIALMAVAIAYLLVDKFAGQLDTPAVTNPVASTGGAEAEAADETAAARQSIAVLPFDNRSRLEEDVYFVDGVHDDLLTNLARISGLKVISRTTVSQFRNTEKTIPEIAGDLGVAHVMEGAVQRSGDTVRINVQLIDAANDEHLWAETYDRQLTADNLFAIQSEISSQIADALEATLSPVEQERISDQPTTSIDAYNAYLRGRQALTLNNSEGAGQALDAFREAVAIDPSFALAWAGYAHAVDHKFRFSDLKLDETIELLERASDRALSLNDQLAEAHLAQDLLVVYRDGRWRSEREAGLIRAMELSPGLAEAWFRYSGYLQQFDDRLTDSLSAIERAAELDPLSKQIRNQQVQVLSSLGRLDEAEQQLNRLIQLDPEFAVNYRTMAGIQASKGRLADALVWQRRAQAKDPGNILFHLREVWFLASMGMDEEYDGLMNRISTLDPNSSTEAFARTTINLRQGRLDAALETATAYANALAPASMGGFGFRGMVQTLRNQPDEALLDFQRVFESNEDEPMGEEGWLRMARNVPDRACTAAWVVAAALDADLGRRMAEVMLEHVENDLLPHRQTELSLDAAQCHVVNDNFEAAQASIRDAIDQKQLLGWWLTLNHPMFDPLRLEPRFQQALADIDRIMTQERERFYALMAEEAQ